MNILTPAISKEEEAAVGKAFSDPNVLSYLRKVVDHSHKEMNLLSQPKDYSHVSLIEQQVQLASVRGGVILAESFIQLGEAVLAKTKIPS